LVPGLLQAEPYAREVNKAEDPRRSDDEVERRVKLRMARQEILHRNRPPKVWAVIDEAALRRQIGGSIVMRAQYKRLLDLAALPDVTLQVLPFDAGGHSGMGSPFTI